MNKKTLHFVLVAVLFFAFSLCILNQSSTFAGRTDGLLEAMDAIGFAPVEISGQTVISKPGDDGDWQSGIPFPEARFKDNGDGTATDMMTGLMWSIDAQEIPGLMNWYQAIDACNNLELAGYSDWRMPNVKEILSLIDYGYYGPALTPGHPFLNVPGYPAVFWSSTTLAIKDLDCFHVGVVNGTVNHVSKYGTRYVWPVRGEN